MTNNTNKENPDLGSELFINTRISLRLLSYLYWQMLPLTICIAIFAALPIYTVTKITIYPLANILSYLITYLVSITFAIGWLIKAQGKIAGFELSSLQAIKDAVHKVFKFIIINILYNLVIICGTILFILPGIYFMFTLCFSFLIYLEKRSEPINALISSFQLAKGSFWLIFLTMLLPISFLMALNSMLYSVISFAPSQTLKIYWYLGSILINVIMLPWFFTTLITLYNHLKQKNK